MYVNLGIQRYRVSDGMLKNELWDIRQTLYWKVSNTEKPYL